MRVFYAMDMISRKSLLLASGNWDTCAWRENVTLVEVKFCLGWKQYWKFSGNYWMWTEIFLPRRFLWYFTALFSQCSVQQSMPPGSQVRYFLNTSRDAVTWTSEEIELCAVKTLPWNARPANAVNVLGFSMDYLGIAGNIFTECCTGASHWCQGQGKEGREGASRCPLRNSS